MRCGNRDGIEASALGSTPAAQIGVPVLGLELKATPVDGQLEARIKGPNVTPGYWRDEGALQSWIDNAAHREKMLLGRKEIFSWYKISSVEIKRQIDWTRKA